MAWQRFNRTTNVFEVSDDNGASWQTLVIAAAGLGSPALPANLAYTNVKNTFTQNQLLSVANPTLIFQDPTGAVDNKKFDIINAAGNSLYFRSLNDADGATVVPLKLDRLGDATAGRDLIATRNFRAISAAYVPGIIEYDRAYKAGDWTSFVPTVVTGGTISNATQCRYTVLGHTAFLNFWFDITTPATAYMQIVWPVGAGYAEVNTVGILVITGTGAALGYGHTQYGYNSLFMYTSAAGGAWGAGSFTIRCMIVIPVYGI